MPTWDEFLNTGLTNLVITSPYINTVDANTTYAPGSLNGGSLALTKGGFFNFDQNNLRLLINDGTVNRVLLGQF